MNRTLSIFSILVLSTPIFAQTATPSRTIPLGFVKKASSIGLSPAWGLANGRIQNFYAPAAAGTAKAAIVIKDLWIRPTSTYKVAQPAHSYDIEIRISSKGAKWAAPSLSSFAGNHGTDMKVLFKRARISFPAVNGQQAMPYAWMPPFKGNTVFIVQKGGGLCIDVKGYSSKTSSLRWFCDSIQSAPTDVGSATKVGLGCPTNFDQLSRYNHVRSSRPWSILGLTREPGDLAFAWLGPTKTNIKLTPSCTIFTLPLITHPQVIKAPYGLASWEWGRIPSYMSGQKLVSQVGAINRKGTLKMSHGLEVTFGRGPDQPVLARSVFGYASRGRPFNPDTGRPTDSTIFANIFGRN